jgi:hypothetical protein
MKKGNDRVSIKIDRGIHKRLLKSGTVRGTLDWATSGYEKEKVSK